ncbi:MAG: amidohydrolase family protein [Rhodothermales bacterium]
MPRLLPVLAFLLLALPVRAQNASPIDPGVRPVTRTFAITNARVIPEPGRVLDRATVVVRDGLIEAVGPNVTPPFDAEIIEGDSLTVYAGFIDGLGHAAIPEVKDDGDDEKVRDPGDPPRDRAGIQPDRSARALLDPTDGSVEALRKLGFTVAHAVPRDGMLAGQGVVILLAGDDADALVLRDASSLFAQFDSASGVYPATPMGILAVLRQLVRDAERRQEGARLYAENPAGLGRPDYDPALAALAPTMSGDRPVFFSVDDVLEAHRALGIAAELGLPLVLGGLRESSHLTDKLAAADVPVFAALALPEAEKDSTATDSVAVAPAQVFITERRTRSYADVDDEVNALKAKRREAIALYERNAATLHAAGIPFGFATLDAKPGDIRENLRRIVAAGLSEDDALAALTTTPAALLGLDRSLGTVEPGKMANLVVTQGSYFAEDAPVRFVFVDGQRFEIDEDAAFDPTAEVVAAGTWDYRVVFDGGVQTGTMTLTDDGGTLGGTLTVEDGSALTMEGVTLTGNRLVFRLPETPFGPLDVSGLIAGDTYTAEVTGPGAPDLTLSATRRPEN